MRKIASTFIFYPKVKSSQFCPVARVASIRCHTFSKTPSEVLDDQITCLFKGKAADLNDMKLKMYENTSYEMRTESWRHWSINYMKWNVQTWDINEKL